MKHIIKKYISDFNHLNKTQIAKLLFTDYPDRFDSVEHARSFVRRYSKDKKSSPMRGNRVSYLSKLAKKVLILNDVHVPYHDTDVMEESLRYGKKNNFDSILINGDFLDCYSVSSFSKDPLRKNMVQEIEEGYSLLAKIKKDYSVDIYFKEGNHEKRVLEHFNKNSPQFAGHKSLTLPHLLGLDELGIQYIGNKKTIVFGGLAILHGHELTCKSGGVNLARNVLHKTYTNTYVGHFHKYDYTYVKDLHGRVVSAYAGGCCCDLHPEYIPNNNWNHTISLVEKSNKGYRIEHFKI